MGVGESAVPARSRGKRVDPITDDVRRLQPGRQVVIKISGNTLEGKMQVIGRDLADLSRMGITPVIVHGGGRQIDEETKAMGIRIRKVEGLRITDRQTIGVVRKVLDGLTDGLVAVIKGYGGSAVNANSKPILAVEKSAPVSGVDLGFVCDVKKVYSKKICGMCAEGSIPVIACMGHDGSEYYNINADTLARKVVQALKPSRFILLTETGGVLDRKGKVMHELDLGPSLDGMVKEGTITEGMLTKVRELRELMSKDKSIVVDVCSAEDMMQVLLAGSRSGTRMVYTRRAS